VSVVFSDTGSPGHAGYWAVKQVVVVVVRM